MKQCGNSGSSDESVTTALWIIFSCLFSVPAGVALGFSWITCRAVQSLKALVLERMGKSDEALSVCLSAKEQLHSNDSALMDDLTLSTLQIVFQRLGHCQYFQISTCSCCSNYTTVPQCLTSSLFYQPSWLLAVMNMLLQNFQTI